MRGLRPHLSLRQLHRVCGERHLTLASPPREAMVACPAAGPPPPRHQEASCIPGFYMHKAANPSIRWPETTLRRYEPRACLPRARRGATHGSARTPALRLIAPSPLRRVQLSFSPPPPAYAGPHSSVPSLRTCTIYCLSPRNGM